MQEKQLHHTLLGCNPVLLLRFSGPSVGQLSMGAAEKSHLIKPEAHFGGRGRKSTTYVLETGNANFATETRDKLTLRINNEERHSFEWYSYENGRTPSPGSSRRIFQSPCSGFKMTEETWPHVNSYDRGTALPWAFDLNVLLSEQRREPCPWKEPTNAPFPRAFWLLKMILKDLIQNLNLTQIQDLFLSGTNWGK